ncbi:MAG: GDSL-type esterase/lipase family protein [Clostridia bacterium]|nr:GDSL-type esterase/lipase family protein [Clostridia bacterium]
MKRFLALMTVMSVLTLLCHQSAVKGEDTKVRIFIAGDSTAQSYGERFAPQGGWGQYLQLFFTSDVEVVNRAIAGRSLKSFFNDGRFGSILEEAAAGDYIIIQFGHNDGAWDKPERYATESEFEYLLRDEYIAAAKARNLNVLLATQTTSRWFNEDTGVIGDTSNVYTNIIRAVAAELALPLLEVNTATREIANALGVEDSKKAYLWVDGVSSDNTHFSRYGAMLVADAVANEIKQNVPALNDKLINGYRITKTLSPGIAAEFDVSHLSRGFERFAVSVSGCGMLRINGEVYIIEGCDDKRVTAIVEAVDEKVIVTSANAVTAELSPLWSAEAQNGFDTASSPLTLYMPDDTYDFTFVKQDTERGSISINSQQVGSNVDMYGTTSIPSPAVHKFPEFKITGRRADIRIGGRTTRIHSASAYLTPRVFTRTRKIYVAGDSTLCSYYPEYPDTEDILPGTRQTGWAQFLERFVTTDAQVVNLASSGDWARNWRDVVFATIENNAHPGDYFIIQFGINDRNRDDKQIITMTSALEDMINRAKAIGVVPIIIKPQASVGYSWGNAGDFERPNGNNGGFFTAVSDCAQKNDVAFIDLYDLSAEHFARVGREFVSQNYHLWDYENNTMRDKLHLSYLGAQTLCTFVCEDIVRQKSDDERLSSFPLNDECEMRKILYTKDSLRLWSDAGGVVRLDNFSDTKKNVTLILCTYEGAALQFCETRTITLSPYSTIYVNQSSCMVML